ncbi:MAG: WbqC family protein [Muribaculaceae bacterium]|nr:WbqC family protein [Muribaculaceae bacterium]
MSIDKTIIAPPAYAGGINYYTELLKHGTVAFDVESEIANNWSLNHCQVLGANGVQTLTIPLVKSELREKTLLKDIKISSHGNWEHLHWGAIFSSYGKSPFFEYIQDDLCHLYENHSQWIVDFDIALHNIIIDFIDLNIRQELRDTVEKPDVMDKTLVERPPKDVVAQNYRKYYQLWHERYGFVPNLSVIDLLMNEGRQAILTLSIKE